MCNIYDHPCKICKQNIEIHLGDDLTSPLEIEVFCKNHIPSNNVVIWNNIKGYDRRGKVSLKKIYTNSKVGVRALTENAKNHKMTNHPNCHNCKIVEERK